MSTKPCRCVFVSRITDLSIVLEWAAVLLDEVKGARVCRAQLKVELSDEFILTQRN
jgi:hypothetical protein